MSMESNSLIQKIKNGFSSFAEKVRVRRESGGAFIEVEELNKKANRFRLIAQKSSTKEKEGYFFDAGILTLKAARLSSKYGLNSLVPESELYFNRRRHIERALALYSTAIEDFGRAGEPLLIIGTEREAEEFLNTLLADKKYHGYAEYSRLYSTLCGKD